MEGRWDRVLLNPLPTQCGHTILLSQTDRGSYLFLDLDLHCKKWGTIRCTHGVHNRVLQWLWCSGLATLAHHSQPSYFWGAGFALVTFSLLGLQSPADCLSPWLWLHTLVSVILTPNTDFYSHLTCRKFPCFYCTIISILKIRTVLIHLS